MSASARKLPTINAENGRSMIAPTARAWDEVASSVSEYKKTANPIGFTVSLELLARFELATSSLPRMRSTCWAIAACLAFPSLLRYYIKDICICQGFFNKFFKKYQIFFLCTFISQIHGFFNKSPFSLTKRRGSVTMYSNYRAKARKGDGRKPWTETVVPTGIIAPPRATWAAATW